MVDGGYYDHHAEVHLRCPMVLVGIATEPSRRLGYWLAATEGLPFTDLDRRVEHLAGRSLWDLVALEGEARYRALERQALMAALRDRPPGIIVAGDGVALDPANRRALADRTHWVGLMMSEAALASAAQRNAQAGFWHPTRREVLMDQAQVRTFHAERSTALAAAAAVIDLDNVEPRALRRQLRTELPVAS